MSWSQCFSDLQHPVPDSAPISITHHYVSLCIQRSRVETYSFPLHSIHPLDNIIPALFLPLLIIKMYLFTSFWFFSSVFLTYFSCLSFQLFTIPLLLPIFSFSLKTSFLSFLCFLLLILGFFLL